MALSGGTAATGDKRTQANRPAAAKPGNRRHVYIRRSITKDEPAKEGDWLDLGLRSLRSTLSKKGTGGLEDHETPTRDPKGGASSLSLLSFEKGGVALRCSDRHFSIRAIKSNLQ